MRVYIARWLATVAAPPIRGAAIAVEGDRVCLAGRAKDVLREAPPDVVVEDLGEVVLVPGLVNAHTHLELSWLAADPPAATEYVSWVEELVDRRASGTPADVARYASDALSFVRARGTAAIGDVANGALTAAALGASGLHGVLFHEIYRLDVPDVDAVLRAERAAVDDLERAVAHAGAAGRVRVALSPHAPHTVAPALLRAIAADAAHRGRPLSIHVAESDAEVEFLRDGTGAMADLFARRGFAPVAFAHPRRSPVEHLDRLGALTRDTLVVHAVHLSHADLSRLQIRGATVVTCPRSNARLAVGRAPVPRLLAEGIPVALGTDSVASAPDLDPFAELAALRREHPGLAPAAALRIATVNGARALGLADRLGTLEPGKLAAIVAIPLDPGVRDPLDAATSGPAVVRPLGTLAA